MDAVCQPVRKIKHVVSLSVFTLLIATQAVSVENPELFIHQPQGQKSNDPSDANEPLIQHRSRSLNYTVVNGNAIMEGDIVLGKVNSRGLLISDLNDRGVGLNSLFSRWPYGIVPYAFDNNTEVQRDNIARAIAHWTTSSTVSFIERTPENADSHPNYIKFMNSSNCASHVGMQGFGEQPVYVSDGCTTGSVIHEIGHALGLFHEHTRPDRDNFVTIDWENILPDKEINFEILQTGVESYGPYDYGSIMHYGANFFSVSSDPVITVPDGVEIGQRISLSEYDISAVDTMYATDLGLSAPVIRPVQDGLEIDLSIHNYGDLGAHNLQLLMRLNNDSIWQRISPNSGWECLSMEAEMRCLRNTMDGLSESRFTILVDPGNGNSEALAITLNARNSDPDPSNNGYNDETTDWQFSLLAGNTTTEDTDLERGADRIAGSSASEQPDVAAAQTSDKTAVIQADGSGSPGISLLYLLLAALGFRMLRKTDTLKQQPVMVSEN